MPPSLMHGALLLLFRHRPELAPELLRDALHVSLPSYATVRIESADLGEIVPTEYHADLVVLLVDEQPVLGIVVEVQLQPDERKRFTWPAYAVGLRARLECPTCVLVVVAHDDVAAWAAVPIDLGPGSTFVPFVVAPSAVPVVRAADRARRDPELAVLSVMAHGKGDPVVAAAIAAAALSAAHELDEERGLLYSDLVRSALGAAAREAFEELMATGKYVFQSDFARSHEAIGEARGVAIGEARGVAHAVITLLDTRGLTVSREQRETILAETDKARLDAWLRRAVTASSAAEMLHDG